MQNNLAFTAVLTFADKSKLILVQFIIFKKIIKVKYQFLFCLINYPKIIIPFDLFVSMFTISCMHSL